MTLKTAKVRASKTSESSAQTNFFDAATPILPGGKAKAAKPTHKTHSLLEYASIDAVQKTLETLKEGYKGQINDQQVEEYLEAGLRQGKRPDNYRGVDGFASASLELRKRSDRSPLDEVQVHLLNKFGVETEKVTSYSLNSEVVTPAIMALLNKALNSVSGIPPNLFKVESKTIVTDASLDQVFKLKEPIARECLKIVGVTAIKAKVEGEDYGDTLTRVVEILGSDIKARTETKQ